MIEWKLVTKKISQLKKHPKNPRSLSSDQAFQLQNSLEKFGLIEKPIITSDNLIIGGHQRVSILKKLKEKEIECWQASTPMDEKDVDELNIRLNKNTGEFDFDILANQWEMTDLITWGFDPAEFCLDETVEEIATEENLEDVLEPGKDEDAKTKLGDVYELNEHRIICGDSTLPDYVSKLLNGAEPILMVTDPPYGVEYDPSWRIGRGGKAGNHIKASGKVQNDDKINWSLAWHLFNGSVAYIWYASLFGTEVEQSLKENDFKLISQIIWNKQNFTLSRGDYHWKHETCLYAVKKDHNHNWQGSRKESSVWDISSMSAMGGSKDQDCKTAHSTQKPIECMAKPIRNNTAIGEGVYDPFLGSGTTLIAAEQLGRICYGIELSPAYCDIIVNRWKNWMIKNNKSYTIKLNGEHVTT